MNVSNANPGLLIFDNDCSHLSLKVIKPAEENDFAHSYISAPLQP